MNNLLNRKGQQIQRLQYQQRQHIKQLITKVKGKTNIIIEV